MSERIDVGADLTIAGTASDSERTDAGADLTIAGTASDSERTDAGADLTIAGAASDSERTDAGADLTIAGTASDSERTDAGADLTIAGTASDAVRREPDHRLRPDPPGAAAKAAADRTRGYYARCVPLLARLRLLASEEAGAPLPPGAAGEVGHAATAIVAEADAAGHAAVAAVAESSRDSAAVFLAARQARLTAAAADVVAAAADGSAAVLSRHLRRFEALTSALWTVQHAICAPDDRRPSRRTWQHRLPDSKPGYAPAAGS